MDARQDAATCPPPACSVAPGDHFPRGEEQLLPRPAHARSCVRAPASLRTARTAPGESWKDTVTGTSTTGSASSLGGRAPSAASRSPPACPLAGPAAPRPDSSPPAPAPAAGPSPPPAWPPPAAPARVVRSCALARPRRTPSPGWPPSRPPGPWSTAPPPRRPTPSMRAAHQRTGTAAGSRPCAPARSPAAARRSDGCSNTRTPGRACGSGSLRTRSPRSCARRPDRAGRRPNAPRLRKQGQSEFTCVGRIV